MSRKSKCERAAASYANYLRMTTPQEKYPGVRFAELAIPTPAPAPAPRIILSRRQRRYRAYLRATQNSAPNLDGANSSSNSAVVCLFDP
jgi:hypothetical protein